jgi:ATP-dependent RNA helicase SUPV3L1/SUV3
MEMPGSPYASAQPVEMESFFTFTWAGRAQRRGQQERGARPEGRNPRREQQPRSERPQGDRRPRAANAAEPAQLTTTTEPVNREARPEREVRSDRPRFDKGKPRGDRPDRGPRPDRPDRGGRGDRAQNFEAHPPREENKGRARIDPDNPFAAALAGFKPK